MPAESTPSSGGMSKLSTSDVPSRNSTLSEELQKSLFKIMVERTVQVAMGGELGKHPPEHGVWSEKDLDGCPLREALWRLLPRPVPPQ